MPHAAFRRHVPPILVALVALGVCGLFTGYVKDDAYISFRYAANLVHGNGLVFNAGERLEGYTNFLWVLLAAVAHLLGAGPDNAIALWTCRVVSVGALMTLPWAVQRLAGHLGATGTRAGAVAAGATLAVVLHPAIGLYAMSGLEAIVFVVLTAWIVERWLAGAFGWALALATVSALLRPEGHLLVMLAGLGALQARHWRALILPTGVLGAYHTFRWLYFGALLPNTFRVKSGSGAFPWRGTEVAVDTLLYGSGPVLLVLAALGLLLVRSRRTWAVGALAGFFIAYLIWVGGDTMRWGRLALPALPLLAAVGAAGLHALWTSLAPEWPRLASGLALLPVVVAPLLGFSDLRERVRLASPVHDAMWANQYRAGRDLAGLLPAGAIVVGQDMGLMPYTTPELRFIDSVGLVSGDVAEALARYGVTPYGVKNADAATSERVTEEAYKEIRDRIFARDPAAFILVAHLPADTLALDAAATEVGPLRAYRGFFGTFARRLDRDPRLELGYTLVKRYKRASDYVILAFVRNNLVPQAPAHPAPAP